MGITGQTKASIEFIELFDAETFAEGNTHRNLLGHAAHGVNIAEVHHGRLVAQVLEGHVGEVEMNAFHQHVGGDENVFVAAIVQHGAVVTNAMSCLGVLGLDVLGEMPDQTKLTQFAYLC